MRPTGALTTGGNDVSKSLLVAAVCGAVLVPFALATSASAADRGFCRDYARAAANQVRAARSHYRCDWRVDRNPARWSTDWRAHFDWCLSATREQADFERDARRDTLEHCTRRRDF